MIDMNVRVASLFAIFSLAWNASSSPIKLRCEIVGGDQSFTVSAEAVSNRVAEVNRIFRQVALSFDIESIVVTNDETLLEIDLDNVAQRRRLYSMIPNGDWLKIFFVRSILQNSTAVWNPLGIIIESSAPGLDIAHEIGHACGLEDIYDDIVGSNFVMSVSGRISKQRMPDDWGRYSGSQEQREIISRLLMFGFANRTGADISYGDVDGLWFDASNRSEALECSNCWSTVLAPVGFHYHGNRHPKSGDL